jgi:thiamine transporter
MRSQRTRLIVEIALTAALSAVLSMFAVRLPINFAGGTISLSMVPIFVLALRRGAVAGIVAGVVFGMADMLIEPFFVAPAQVFLDYIVAFGAVGLAGLGSGAYQRALDRSQWLALAVAVPFMVLGGTARFIAAWTSGVIFFGMNAPAGQPVWLYSIVYNLSYIVPSVIVSITAALLVLPVLERAVPVRDGSAVTVA